MADTYWQVLSFLIEMYTGVVKIYLYVLIENYVLIDPAHLVIMFILCVESSDVYTGNLLFLI